MMPRALLAGTLAGALAGLVAAVGWTSLSRESPELGQPSLTSWQRDSGSRPADSALAGRGESVSQGQAALSQRLDALERTVGRLVEQLELSNAIKPPAGMGSNPTESDPVATVSAMRTHLEGQVASERKQLEELREQHQSNPRYLNAAEEQLGTSIRFYEGALAALHSVRTAADVAQFKRDYADALVTYSSGR